jgi:hypothetical protein
VQIAAIKRFKILQAEDQTLIKKCQTKLKTIKEKFETDPSSVYDTSSVIAAWRDLLSECRDVHLKSQTQLTLQKFKQILKNMHDDLVRHNFNL